MDVCVIFYKAKMGLNLRTHIGLVKGKETEWKTLRFKIMIVVTRLCI